MAGPTLTVRGEGGAVFELDLPAPGSVRREIFDEQIAKGQLFVLSGMPDEVEADEAAVEPEADEPEGEGVEVVYPAGNASRAEWVAFAVAQGAEEADVVQLKRDTLAELYGPKEGD